MFLFSGLGLRGKQERLFVHVCVRVWFLLWSVQSARLCIDDKMGSVVSSN